ncbi:MAG: ribosome small subunit-dependent GTPase A [Bacilli bacterium]
MELTKGKIIKINKDIYTIKTINSVFPCSVRGKIKDNLVVGDNVNIDIISSTIEEILPRKNSLIRPKVANIDKLIIVISAKKPDFSSYLLDKFLCLSEVNNIIPIIVITKIDLLSTKEYKNIKKIIKYYKTLGYKVFPNTKINKIKHEFMYSVVSLTGQTGAGKSTLLNRIDKNLNLATDEISEALGRGKHTTRIVTLHEICNGLVADTPGFSSLELNLTKNQIKDSFIEFKYNCKYSSCMHIKEEECDVKRRVKENKILSSRYNNYIKLIQEVEK